MLPGIGAAPVCDYDADNLKWCRKSIINSIPLDLCDSIEKYLGIRDNRTATYAAVISKIQQVILCAIPNLFDNLSKMSCIKEPGKDVEVFRSQVIDKTQRIIGSVSAPNDIKSIVVQCFIECDVILFKLKALQFYNI